MNRMAHVGAVAIAVCLFTAIDFAQSATHSSHLTIPFLANATKPMDLDFEGGECEVASDGAKMTCQFEQVMITTSDVAPQTCFVTTNHYDRIFEKETATRWVNRQAPEGACGIVDTTTLQDDGGVKWTMEMRKIVTAKNAPPACRDADERPEIMSWQNVRRPLPCTFIQPGSLSR
jgi:hypothetical protein